jgi:hypothetical protein
MHYARIRRNGHLGTVHTPPRPRGAGPCTVQGCGKRDTGTHGLCAAHYSRLTRNGDPCALRGVSRRKQEQNPNWRGDDIKYRAAHERLRAQRGAAEGHQCIDCGKPAAHWSYNHTDHNQQQSDCGLPFSVEPRHYSPRCVPCHKAFDVGRKAVAA